MPFDVVFYIFLVQFLVFYKSWLAVLAAPMSVQKPVKKSEDMKMSTVSLEYFCQKPDCEI